jgi:hypothetical protein
MFDQISETNFLLITLAIELLPHFNTMKLLSIVQSLCTSLYATSYSWYILSSVAKIMNWQKNGDKIIVRKNLERRNRKSIYIHRTRHLSTHIFCVFRPFLFPLPNNQCVRKLNVYDYRIRKTQCDFVLFYRERS